MIGRIILGLLMVVVGFLIVWKTEWINSNFGSISWAEAKMGSMGGSRLLYKLIGLTFIFIGFLTVTNLHQAFFVGAFGWLFGVDRSAVQ
jgi:hypothetical protein